MNLIEAKVLSVIGDMAKPYNSTIPPIQVQAIAHFITSKDKSSEQQAWIEVLRYVSKTKPSAIRGGQAVTAMEEAASKYLGEGVEGIDGGMSVDEMDAIVEGRVREADKEDEVKAAFKNLMSNIGEPVEVDEEEDDHQEDDAAEINRKILAGEKIEG